jgi:hypothetical protein
VRGTDIRSQEQRLMPEYIQKFFLRAAEREKLTIRQRADGLYAIEHVPMRLRDRHLPTARGCGVPSQEYRKLTFDKTVQQRPEHQDAILLSPGHPLFAALTEVLTGDLRMTQGQAAVFVDPLTNESYRVHFFEVQIVSEEPIADSRHSGDARTQVLYATLAAVLDTPGGRELAPADLLHDLTPLPEDATVQDMVLQEAPVPQEVVQLEQWVRIKVQFPLKQQQASGKCPTK